MWSIEKLMDALGLELPIIQAPDGVARTAPRWRRPSVKRAAAEAQGSDDFYLAVVGASDRPRLGDVVGRPDPHHR